MSETSNEGRKDYLDYIERLYKYSNYLDKTKYQLSILSNTRNVGLYYGLTEKEIEEISQELLLKEKEENGQ